MVRSAPEAPPPGAAYHGPATATAAGQDLRRAAERTRFWAHATAFGAAWGAFEITLGAALHALHIPLAGVVLSSLGAALLVAQRQLLPERGASLATAAVAALCKSISPDGLVLGPMVAILMEGVLVEAALLVAPRAAATAAAAGALCALWSAFQKLVTQVVFFGGDVVELYLSALRGLGRALDVSPGAGWTILVGFCLVVVAVGVAGGLWGRVAGREAARRLAAAEDADGC